MIEIIYFQFVDTISYTNNSLNFFSVYYIAIELSRKNQEVRMSCTLLIMCPMHLAYALFVSVLEILLMLYFPFAYLQRYLNIVVRICWTNYK